MSLTDSAKSADHFTPTASVLGFRFIGWTVVGTLFAYLFNIYLRFWREWPGARSAFGPDATMEAWIQALIYVVAIAGPAVFVLRTQNRTLRQDDLTISAIAAYIARFAFWVVFLIGIVDATLSFLRVEGFLEFFVGTDITTQLGRSQFRVPYVHAPLIVLSLVLAAVTRTLGFTWLALLVVVAELQIVVSRFVFSYEQAFMGDMVRFWYGGLFLFSSAYTLIEEGHVRVDVLYSGFSDKTKGMVNAAGSVLLGLPLCWVILVIGMGQSTAIITSPILRLEVSQSGFGMYVKYLLAGYLLIFAVTMTLQFAAYLLEGIADYRGDPGKRKLSNEIIH
ncbi:MAG: TRAP transporter small permease subunit [Alphaproteobacteria bacterium]|nr:TRAP transporter small permease subunit [Alphaproteobacteria bacterium]